MIAVNAAERVGWGNLEFGREVHDDLSNAEIDMYVSKKFLWQF